MNREIGVVDENMTSGGGGSSASNSVSASFLYPRPRPRQSASTSTTTIQEAPQPKRKRNLPGHPDPEAEVISLSPKTLMATNRFVCDICNKGFQRDQNLQLHRRGHNLPWKLKQRNKHERVRKKVYVCPEATCVHHDPSRALGDLTGIKKHFSRKHGEKNWKCDKCDKRYAVHSDWKAHFKICGTREYKCDCGTLFSRRDSFIAHRAFCEALAQESSKVISGGMNPLLSSSHNTQLLHAAPTMKKEFQEVSLRAEIPSWFGHGRSLKDLGDFTSAPTSNGNPNNTMLPPISAFQAIATCHSSSSTTHHHMYSATALLQKASQIGATMSRNNTHAGHVSAAESSAPTAYNSNMQQHSREEDEIGTAAGLFSSPHALLASYESGKSSAETITTPNHDTMNIMMDGNDNNNNNHNNNNVVSAFEEALRGFINQNIPTESHKEEQQQQVNHDEMTRDFLGINGVFPQRDFFNISGFDHHHHFASSSYANHNHNQPPWQG